jgi:hypothetical protein
MSAAYVPTDPRPVLRPEAVYQGDNGRVFCGSPGCAGASALYTGRDLSGQKVHRLGRADVRAWIAEVGRAPCCETCGREAGLVVLPGGDL